MGCNLCDGSQFSKRDKVSKSSSKVNMRSLSFFIKAKNCSRLSAGKLGKSCMVSTKPLITVKGVRNSCDTLAMKSERVWLSFSIGVMSWLTNNCMYLSKGVRLMMTVRGRPLRVGRCSFTSCRVASSVMK